MFRTEYFPLHSPPSPSSARPPAEQQQPRQPRHQSSPVPYSSSPQQHHRLPPQRPVFAFPYGVDPPRPPHDGTEWVWFPEGYWAERPVVSSFSSPSLRLRGRRNRKRALSSGAGSNGSSSSRFWKWRPRSRSSRAGSGATTTTAATTTTTDTTGGGGDRPHDTSQGPPAEPDAPFLPPHQQHPHHLLPPTAALRDGAFDTGGYLDVQSPYISEETHVLSLQQGSAGGGPEAGQPLNGRSKGGSVSLTTDGRHGAQPPMSASTAPHVPRTINDDTGSSGAESPNADSDGKASKPSRVGSKFSNSMRRLGLMSREKDTSRTEKSLSGDNGGGIIGNGSGFPRTLFAKTPWAKKEAAGPSFAVSNSVREIFRNATPSATPSSGSGRAQDAGPWEMNPFPGGEARRVKTPPFNRTSDRPLRGFIDSCRPPHSSAGVGPAGALGTPTSNGKFDDGPSLRTTPSGTAHTAGAPGASGASDVVGAAAAVIPPPIPTATPSPSAVLSSSPTKPVSPNSQPHEGVGGPGRQATALGGAATPVYRPLLAHAATAPAGGFEFDVPLHPAGSVACPAYRSGGGVCVYHGRRRTPSKLREVVKEGTEVESGGSAPTGGAGITSV